MASFGVARALAICLCASIAVRMFPTRVSWHRTVHHNSAPGTRVHHNSAPGTRLQVLSRAVKVAGLLTAMITP